MNILKIISVSLLVISLASCKRHYADGPSKTATNISASSGFTCGTLGTSGIADFGLGLPFNFTASFAETVTWKIELIGQSSTATKTISGTSSFIDATNGSWIGNHDGVYYFEQGETVTANLIISGKAGICTSTTFTLANVRDEKSATPTFMLIDKYADMENPSAVFPYQFSIFPTTTTYAPNYKMQDDTIRAPQGVRYLRLEGTSIASNGIFVGGVQCRVNPGATAYFLPITWTDPTKIYLNVFVRGVDNLPLNNTPYATLSFECHEDDNKNASNAGNCQTYNNHTGANPDNFCPSSEDAWVYQVKIQHIGWQLFSCKYSDLLPSADIMNGGAGNRKLEPQKIARVQLGVLANNPFHHISIDVDYACFTYGAPLDPTK